MSVPEFRPLPLLANPHVQTLLSVWLKTGHVPGATRRHRVTLADGDQLVLHENTPRDWRAGDFAALVLHGLTGSHQSGGVVLQSRRLFQRGVRVFRLDLRGAGAGFSLARKGYHAGCTSDVRAALHVVRAQSPQSPIFLVGTSLGGNVALKLAGELYANPEPGLTKIAALNPPIDLLACTSLLMLRRNAIYERYFVYELVKAAKRRARLFRDPRIKFPRRLRLRDFDDLHTAPCNGFNGVDDYYSRASSQRDIETIGIPTLILTAEDDPFIDVAPIRSLRPRDCVQVEIVPSGGHTGFLGRDHSGGIGWAETRIADWLMRELP